MLSTIKTFRVLHHKINFKHLRLYHNIQRSLFQSFHKNPRLTTFNKLLFSNTLSKIKYYSNKATEIKPGEEQAKVLSFQQMVCLRKKQAQNSVLVEIHNIEDICSAISACEKFGDIKSICPYDGESQNVFLLFEFNDETSVKRLLSECRNENIIDAFTISSRILNFTKQLSHCSPKTDLNVYSNFTSDFKRSKPTQVSELIEDLYFSEKLSDLSIRLRFFFCELLKDSIAGLFPHCEIFPFGSSVNGIGREGCDLDVMIRLYPLPSQKYQFSEFSFLNRTCPGKVQDLQRRCVHGLGGYFRTFLPGLIFAKEVLNARVPILKLEHKILGMHCDISFNQMSAVMMSEMLYFCGEVDRRVRPLLFAVKKWAKDTNVIYEGPGTWITNFGLSLLVIFFLQNRPSPILPCFNDAMKIVGSEGLPNFQIDYLMSLPDLKAKASLNEESVAELLNQFLAYLGSNPFKDLHISVLSGLASKTKTGHPIWIQYPLEEEKNVTKNVSLSQLNEMCQKAYLSYEYLSDCLKHKEIQSEQLSILLGSPYIMTKYPHKSIKS